MTDLYLDALQADVFRASMGGGIRRAEDRYRARLNTVDENGDLVEEPVEDSSKNILPN